MSRAEVSGVTPAPLPLPLLPLLPLIPSPPVNPESPAEAGGCCWAPPEGVWGDRSPQSLKKVGFLSTLMRETAPRTPEHCPQPLPQFPNLRWPCPFREPNKVTILVMSKPQSPEIISGWKKFSVSLRVPLIVSRYPDEGHLVSQTDPGGILSFKSDI